MRYLLKKVTRYVTNKSNDVTSNIPSLIMTLSKVCNFWI